MSANVPDPVKAIVHAGSRSYGRVTAARRMLPSFLISGGQRCGTTSLYRALAWHPAILKPVLHKGVHYFDTSYRRGLRWYRAHFPLERTARRVEEQLGVRPQAFESSPYYMYHPLAPGRIAADLPGVKLIALVRDPVERAHSQHEHELARRFEDEPSFTWALRREAERTRGEHRRLAQDPGYYSFAHQHLAYRARGEYATHLETMAAAVGRERILVIESERFFARPRAVYDQVLAFLGLPSLGYPPFERHNARPRSAPLDEAVRAELTAHYAPHDERLAEWLGHTPTWRS